MTYDAARQRVVLFGGYDPANGTTARADTWEWDGLTWQPRTPAHAPPATYYHAMTYDAARSRVVLFGGSSASTTWEWDGTDWADRTSAPPPTARSNPALVYDGVRHRVILFGGIEAGTNLYLQDTWEWDGTTWVQRAPAASPPLRVVAGSAWDAARQRIVLFGGYGGDFANANPATCVQCPQFLGDVWDWSGSTWTQHTVSVAPGPRSFAAMAYDTARQRVLLFGGWTGNLYPLDTWEWDGTGWLQRSPAASPDASGGYAPLFAMAYDEARQRMVMFGGSDGHQTWQYVP